MYLVAPTFVFMFVTLILMSNISRKISHSDRTLVLRVVD
jgi:hypothetical protein